MGGCSTTGLHVAVSVHSRGRHSLPNIGNITTTRITFIGSHTLLLSIWEIVCHVRQCVGGGWCVRGITTSNFFHLTAYTRPPAACTRTHTLHPWQVASDWQLSLCSCDISCRYGCLDSWLYAETPRTSVAIQLKPGIRTAETVHSAGCFRAWEEISISHLCLNNILSAHASAARLLPRWFWFIAVRDCTRIYWSAAAALLVSALRFLILVFLASTCCHTGRVHAYTSARCRTNTIFIRLFSAVQQVPALREQTWFAQTPTPQTRSALL